MMEIMSWAKLACGSSMATCKERRKPFRNSYSDNIHDLMWERANLEAASALCFLFYSAGTGRCMWPICGADQRDQGRERLRH